MKRALVVASETRGLRGANNDARSMAEMLRARGFDEVDLRIDRDATRDGILAGYDRLAERSQPGDAAVVYYSGHGYHAAAPGTRHDSWQCLVPTDLDDGSVHDWRGITAWELSIKQAQLTAKTKNVTVILDCCHSAQMSRDAAARDAIPRALAHPEVIGFEAHLAALRARYGSAAFNDMGGSGNPDAVRVTACGQIECAYEHRSLDGEFRGAFTEALIAVLREVGNARISWTTVCDAIRVRVLRKFATQRPDVEGPSRRRLFELDEIELGGIVTVASVDGEPTLPVGRLLGAVPGDKYGVMRVGSTAYEDRTSFAKLEVTDVRALDSSVRVLAWENGHTAFPPDSVAVPLTKQAPKRAVVVDAPPDERIAIEAAIHARNTLRVAAPEESEAAVAIVRFENGALTLEDEKGPLYPPELFPRDLKIVIDNVANLAVAEAIRELDGAHGVHAKEVEIEFGVLDQGQLRPLPSEGASLALRDRVYVQIRNQSLMGRTLYAHVFNIGLRGKVTLLTSFAPTGVALPCGSAPFVLGRGGDGQLRGLTLKWPPEMPRASFPRIDEVVVIVTTKPTSLTALETSEHLSTTRSYSSSLEAKLAQIQDGEPKNVCFDADDGYYMKLMSYLLHPREGAMGGTSFEIDENPLGQAAAREPRAWLVPGVDDVGDVGVVSDIARGAAPISAAPRAIAIRLGELVVERNRAVFGADVRVDALVCTRSSEPGGGARAWTQKFDGIRDGERLPLENALLFHGPVNDFVDIVLWVSRDTRDSLDLAKLIAERANSPELTDAAGALVIGTGAVVAPWIAAVGASAVMARMAYEVLLKATGASIGLYRTSYLASERFGAGRHPIEGLYRAQDFSFSLLIEPV